MFLCSCSSLTTLPKTLGQKVDLFYAHNKSFEEDVFFSKKPQKILLDSLNSVLINLLDSLPRVRYILLKIWKMVRRYMFFFPKELLKKIPTTCRMPFWQPWWSVFAEKPKYFAVNERKWWKILIFSKKFFSSKLSFGHLDIRYDDPSEMFLPEVGNLLLELGKWIRSYVFKFFSQTLPLDT